MRHHTSSLAALDNGDNFVATWNQLRLVPRNKGSPYSNPPASDGGVPLLLPPASLNNSFRWRFNGSETFRFA